MTSGSVPSMTAEELAQGWHPLRVGRRIEVYAEVSSTNTVALEAADKSDVDGLVVLADYQTSGRGRLGRSWQSPRRASVLCSVLLLMDDPSLRTSGGKQDRVASADDPGIGGRLTLLAAVSVCAAVRQATEITPSIKWPNDVLINGRKVGGILIESRALGGGGRAWVIGIGLNCHQQAGHFPPELRETATSLDLAASHPIDQTAVARELLRALDARLVDPGKPSDRELHDEWSRYAEPIGRRVRLRCDGREYAGQTLAVEPHGGLIVQCDGGVRKWFDPLRTTLL